MSALCSKGLGNTELNIHFLYILFSQSLYNLNVLHVVIKCDIFKNDVTKMGGGRRPQPCLPPPKDQQLNTYP